MANKRLSMRKIREVLRLHLVCKLSQNQIARSCSISRSAVCDCVERAEKAGFSWPLPEEFNDDDLEKRMYEKDARWKKENQHFPDWPEIHKEMRKPSVTRYLLWQEYKEATPEGIGYSRFCDMYREWVKGSEPTLRQVHKAGEKMFVDYAGQTIPVIDPNTNEISQAQIFVAVLGASNYTYAEASFSQNTPSWIGAHVRALEYFGGVPQAVVPDNLKSAITKSCRYEPDINKTYNDLAIYYGFAVIPSRVAKPRDKAKVETAVQIVERWILAALRNKTFHNLSELNKEILSLLELLNNKPFQKLPGSRRSVFNELEKPILKDLPKIRYEFAEFKEVSVNIDYHVEFEGHYYSVPYQFIKERMLVRATVSSIEIFFKNKRVASHYRSRKKGLHSTIKEHMPKAHQKYMEWTPSRIISWAESIGEQTGKVAKIILDSRAHPQQGFRQCLGIIRLSDTFGKDRLEAACVRAIRLNCCTFKSVKSILKSGLDSQAEDEQKFVTKQLHHQNIRGEEILN